MDNIMMKEALFWTLDGKRKRGGPKITWRRTAAKELASAHLSWSGVQKQAAWDWSGAAEKHCGGIMCRMAIQ